MNPDIKKWFGGILLLLCLLCITPWVIGWKMNRVVASIEQKKPSIEVTLYENLNLTQSQKEQIQKLDQAYKKQLVEFCEHHCSSKMKMAKLLQSGQTDLASLQKVQSEVNNAYISSEQLTLQHVLQVSQVLTLDQRTLFLKKFGEHIQATCPMEFVQPKQQ